MLKSKNISLRRLTLVISFILSLVGACYYFFFTSDLSKTIGLFFIIGILAYLLILYFIDRFVYRKIKLIYKFISLTKASKREEFYNNELLPAKTIDEVNDEVQKWAEERKSEIERLQSNEQFRKEFLMNLAHELKTPLFSAQGYIETLMDGALTDEKVNTLFLQKASNSIERLSELVKDLDEISKIESNQIPIDKSVFIIHQLIKEVFDELQLKADVKKIQLKIKKGCEQEISVYADRSKMKQVFINLVENSINYGKQDGQTTAGIYVVDGKQVLIEITDDGMGIQEEHLPRLFERFYRTDLARARNVGGSGLGLAIVKHIIEAHGHNVSCRSKLDVGTSFTFSLDQAKS